MAVCKNVRSGSRPLEPQELSQQAISALGLPPPRTRSTLFTPKVVLRATPATLTSPPSSFLARSRRARCVPCLHSPGKLRSDTLALQQFKPPESMMRRWVFAAFASCRQPCTCNELDLARQAGVYVASLRSSANSTAFYSMLQHGCRVASPKHPHSFAQGSSVDVAKHATQHAGSVLNLMPSESVPLHGHQRSAERPLQLQPWQWQGPRGAACGRLQLGSDHGRAMGKCAMWALGLEGLNICALGALRAELGRAGRPAVSTWHPA